MRHVKILITWIFVHVILLNIHAQVVTDYQLRFELEEGVGNAHVEVSFNIAADAPDTVWMNFGGGLQTQGFVYTEDEQTDSTFHIVIKCNNIKHKIIDSRKQRIGFVPNHGLISTVFMSYDYCNMSAAIEYPHPTMVIWDTGASEFYYPFVTHSQMDIRAEFVVPDGVEVMASYPVRKRGNSYILEEKVISSRSLRMAFLQKKYYSVDTIQIPYAVPVYRLKGYNIDAQLKNIESETPLIMDFYAKAYKEPYISPKHCVRPLQAIIFGYGGGLQNHVNFISVPLFSSIEMDTLSRSPSLAEYSPSLAHELGHRWISSDNLFISKGQPGAYFIVESLNEFMTLMCFREINHHRYLRRMANRRKSYADIKGTKRDRALFDMRRNNNFDVVYAKGPLILDEFAQRIGYDEMVRIIAEFYRRYDLKPGLRYEDFISTVADLHPEIANELDQRLRSI